MPTYDVDVEGVTYEVDAPNPDTAWQWANYTHRQKKAAAPKPESGFIPALKAGATELGGGISALAGKLGLKDEAKAEAEYKAAKEKAAGIFKPTEEGWTEAPFTKFKELLGGSLPYMAAPLAAGAAAAALPVTGTAAALTTLGAAGLTSAGQFTATNLARQMEEGKTLAETSLPSAAAAAVPQALLDTLSMRMIPGIGRMFGQAGVKITAENAKQIAEQGLKKTLIDYTAKTGKTAGIEGATEAAQQVFERLQAGLNITDEKAREEYFDSFLGGAVLGGTLAPAGRYVERGREQREARGLLESQAAAERKAAREAEEAKKKSPEYLQDLEARYQAAMQQKAQLDAAIVKPPKDADPATKIAYRDAVRARDEFAKTEMAEVAREYAARKKDIDALNQQRGQEAELAAQGIPQAEQKLPYYESAQGTIPGLEAVEPAEPAAPAEEAPDYAAQAQNLRSYLDDLREKAQATTDLDAKLRIGEEFARIQKALDKAETLAKEEGQGVGKKIESLRRKMATAEESGDIAVQVDLAKQLKALGVTDLGAQAALDLGKPQALGKLQVPSDMADYQAAQQRAAEEKAAREAQQRQQQQLAKEAYERSLQTADLYSGVAAAAQRRAADRAAAEAETRAEAERTQREEEMVGKLVQATGAVQPQPVPQARMALPTGETTESLYDQATELRAQLSFAQQTRNKNLEARVRQQLQQIGASTEERGSALDLGATAREAGVEGELTPDAMEQNRLTRLAQRQLMSYDQLVKFITQAREREQTTVDEKTKAQYKYRAEQLKQAAIGFALQEINGRRQQYGLPVLEHKEAMRAVTGLARPLNELIARGAQIFEEPVVVRGQQRGIRLVEGAQEFERPPAGKRTFSEAGFPAAADTLREQFRKTVETVSGVPAAPAPAAFGKPPGPVRKVVPEQRELFLTPPPAEEPVSLAPTALLDKAADKAASSDDAQLLRQMQEVYTQLTPEQQSVVREQAQRAADGKPLDAVYEMRGLYQLQQREAATAAGQQTFLKPITLVTARRKIERLAQQAAALEKQAAEAKALVERIEAGRKSEVERAQAAFDRAREQGKDLIATASQLRGEQIKERLDAANKIAELELKKRELDKEWDDVVAGQFAWLQTRYEFLREEVAAGRAPKTNRAELAQLEKIYPGAIDRVVKASKALDRINKQIAAAKDAQQAVLERQAADTVTGSLLKQATKAQNKIDAAQQKLSEARAAEKAAERVHKATLAAEPKTPTLLEQIEAIPITGVTRVFRDTSDPAVQAQATKKRSAIAREEGTYAILEERLKTAEGDDRVKLQQQLNESEARLQKLHNELYDVYSNAPMKRVQGTTVEAAASAERLEKAQHAVQDAEIDAFNAKHDTARLSLPPRKAGPMISEKGVVKQGGERVIKAEPATPIAEIASTRKRIDEINQQFAYIKDNPAKSAEGKAKQAKVKTQLAAERQTLVAKLKGLLQSQREVVREEKAVEKELTGARKVSKGAIKRSKLEATDAQLFEDLAKATKTKEQTALFERAENAFGEMSAPDQAFVRRQANAIVGRREADYQGARLADVVAAAERRMAREGEIEFSRGATPNPSTTASVRTELSKAFTDLGRVQIYDSVDALIATNPQYEGKIPSDARGFVDTAGNKAFLIAENINQGQALSVLLHEVGAHIGLKNMLGTAQYNALVKAVETWAKKNDGSIESRVAKAAQARVEAAKTPASQKADETLAYTIEEAVNAGVKPLETKGVLGQWMSQIAALFRKALEKFGLPPKALDAQGLVDMAFGAAKMEMRGQAAPETQAEPSEILFSRNLPTAARVADQLVGQQKGWLQKLRENFLGIGGRAQFVDMRFPLEEALKKGGVEDLDAMQAMYYVRMYDQKMHFTSEAITEGVPEVVEKTRKDGRTERIIEAKAGANLTQAYKILTSKEVIKEAGSADAANKLVTLYMAAIRGANKGYDKLNFGRAWATEEIKRLDGQINAKDTTPEERTNLQKRRKALDDRLDTMPTPEDIKASRAEIEANPVLREAFDKVREVYNEYNRNLLQLAVQTGAISKDHARTLLAQNDYISYYRMRGGVAEMVIGDETPIRIGNIKDNQELQELVGGDEPILDFITSSMQNTSMLVDMSLRNIAMKNAMFELREVGLATVAKAPKGGAPKGSVTFKKDGEDYYAVVNTDALGISSDLLVKGLAGIPTMFPMWVRAMGVPARFLRRAIVAAPPYWAKQVFRDSLGAAMSSGADIVPVLGALRQIGKDNVLERRGITGGQVFTGLPEDKKRMLDAMQAGKVSLTRGMAWLEATAAKADALTRKNQYENYLAQGLSEMEATYMALESMNFSKRGLSPSVHYANILIPFFNSQIQGLDALYKAFTGKMPMNERLEIRKKLWTRGMFMFTLSMAYAWAMQDDEAYKNAKPDEKYGNWFVPLKHFGIDETLRLPIPFELGYIFKGIPEAIVNSVMREEGAKEARDAFTHIAQQTVPGGSSLGIPAAAKTGLEATLGVSLYTMRPIESAQEQMLEPGYRARENTTELARQIGEMTNFSPIKLEFLVRGYTGSMGMAALAALSAPLGGTGPAPATKRLTEMPVVGTLFQPKDAGGIIDATYERLNKVNQLVKTHEDLLNKGRVADAEKYFAEHQDDMALGSLAGSFKQFMGEVTQVERDVRASNITPEKKREYLDYLRQVKIRAAESVRDSVRAASGKTTPQSVPA